MPTPDETIIGPDGKLRKWQPETRNLEAFNYLGPASGFSSVEEAAQADSDSGQGSWVPAAYGGGMPWWMKAFVATGLGSMAVTGLGALAAPGAFGGAGGAGAAGGTGAAGAGGASAAGGAAAAAPSLGVPIGASTTASALSTGAGIAPVALGAAPAAVPTGGSLLGGLLGRGGTANKLFNAGQILSNYASGAAQGRQAEANLNLNADALRQRQIEDERQNAIQRGTLEVTQRKTGQDLEDQARYQAGAADFLKAGPYKVARGDNGAYTGTAPTFEHSNEIADQAYKAAMQRLLSGSDKQFTPQPNIPSLPLTPQPNESWLDKLARWGGTGLGIAGSLGGYRPPTTGGR